MAQKASPPKGKKGKGCLLGCLGLIVFFVLFISGVEIYRRIVVRQMDENFLKTYQPLPDIAEIAEKTSMTDSAKKIFYRAKPEFIGNDLFATYCLGRAGIELALACARSDTPGEKKSTGARIFLLQIDDPQFIDSRFPSAAHEMLHIAYKKLTSNERNRIGLLIDEELAKRPNDAHLTNISDILKKAGEQYQDELRNEMHSILGVEYADLSSELEEYYKQYFIDRTQLVALNENSGLEKRIRQLDTISQEINALDTILTTMSQQISSYQNAGNIDQYNAMVPQFNALVNQYNAKAQQGRNLHQGIAELYKLINPNFQPPQGR